MDAHEKQRLYDLTAGAIRELIEGETDLIAVMATVACELYHRFDWFDWTGFYRVVSAGLLKVGPYQGPHGCLEISFNRGVCGAAARLRQTQIVPDVRAFAGYIACSSSTRSEIVVPVLTPQDRLVAVLDIDSDRPDAFDEVDRTNLEMICRMVGRVG
ncbi:MAG TPA: GAF domain-containing protein [Sedimentisphaerales bacterium]|nr:GAF domain-containing protein [Sedimentisphaerales bacterium]HRS09798.1 GAF domain-containing protein [Sedimentisphaerales bacterium]HRV46552.1 GAF domain-containing protein [Sedimentisphaerales bacterium]